MNLKGRYDMLRQATLQLVGLPDDNLENLKALAQQMRVAATVDPDAAVSLLMVQTLIVTHSKVDAQAVADIKQQRVERVGEYLTEELCKVSDDVDWRDARWSDDIVAGIMLRAGGAT